VRRAVRSPAMLSLASRLHAGIRSNGVRRFYFLVHQGRDEHDLRIFDITEQGAPSAGSRMPRHQARREVLAAQALCAHADALLGWIGAVDGTCSVREHSLVKGTLPPGALQSSVAQ